MSFNDLKIFQETDQLYPRQVKPQMPPCLIESDRTEYRPDLQPVSHAHWVLPMQGLSGQAAARQISQIRNRQNFGVSDQQFFPASYGHR